MIDISLLEYLIVISKQKSLLEASEKLNMTQPTLTRAIQKLEDELGLKLFDRYSNKMVLNDNGKKVIEESSDLINAYYTFTNKINDYIDYTNQIKIGYISSGIIFKYYDKLLELFKKKKMTLNYDTYDNLYNGLLKKDYDVIFTINKINNPDYISKQINKEYLLIDIPNNHFLSNEKYLSFKDIDGFTFKTNDIEIFDDVIKNNLTKSKFLNTGNDLLYFDTTLRYHMHKDNNRSFIKLTDKQAVVDYYITYNKKLDSILKDIK